MRVLVVGATGTIGKAVADVIAERGHDVIRASRHADVAVDIADTSSIRAMYAGIGWVDAVVSCAGQAKMGPLQQLGEADFKMSIDSKLMGQVNLVRFGIDHVRDEGVFVLTAGIFSQRAPAGASAAAMVNGALESFARAAAKDLPRRIRLVTVSPPLIKETAAAMGIAQAGKLSARDNAERYVDLLVGDQTGQVVYT
jgi:NAD(P)-dependent dehydrogenase (short-subunit alcohol dehydrogenase family)